MDWLDLLAVRGILRSLLQHHSSKASILQHSVFFMVQLWHPYMMTGKTIALTIQIFVGKVMSLLFDTLSRLIFLPRRKYLLISWLQSPSAGLSPHYSFQSSSQYIYFLFNFTLLSWVSVTWNRKHSSYYKMSIRKCSGLNHTNVYNLLWKALKYRMNWWVNIRMTIRQTEQIY